MSESNRKECHETLEEVLGLMTVTMLKHSAGTKWDTFFLSTNDLQARDDLESVYQYGLGELMKAEDTKLSSSEGFAVGKVFKRSTSEDVTKIVIPVNFKFSIVCIKMKRVRGEAAAEKFVG